MHYSPKMANAVAELVDIIPGMSFDLTTNDVDGKPWDFNIEEKQAKAEKIIKEKRALLLIGSPMCSAFSQIQNLHFSKMSSEGVKKVIRIWHQASRSLCEVISDTDGQ